MATDVVIVNYRTPGLLKQCAGSALDSMSAADTLHIVDVDPVSLVHVPESGYGAGLTGYITVPDNVGYGAACNLGASYGKNDVILFANADTLITSGMQRCAEALMGNSDWGVLGPRQVNEVGRLTAAGIFGVPQAPYMRGWMQRDVGRFSDVRTVAVTVSGSILFIKRRLWDELTVCPLFNDVQVGVGAMLETRLYYEETWLCYHARAHGYRCVYYGPERMVHLWHKSINGGEGYGEDEMVRSRETFRAACKNHGIVCE